MKITWRPRAADDFERLIDLSSAGHIANASRDKSLVETRILQLIKFDQLGRKSRRIGVRELPIEGTPYVVVNRRLDDELLILRIFHTGKAVAA
ncbi:MAG: type II toxin-antitoxin system RelE/ParE family toxin [Alphaproteobacteria bacterium]|jgi:toxin ParE1/3/4|nr:MAG: type II toxin-antitoxin system RelE/ParE family toxin [Alphaproteobacteria bacterium]